MDGGIERELRLLREAKEAAEEAVRLRDLLLAQVAHDLRIPLNAVAASTSLLLDEPIGARGRELAHTARAGCEAAIAVAGGLLDLARLEAGALPLEVVAVDPRQAMRDAIALVTAGAGAPRVSISFGAADNVPAAVATDASRLRQVLVNLVGNALKFTAEGEVRVRAEACDVSGDAVELHFAVSDTGVGIAPEDVSRLFRPFSRLEAGERASGTGLGLAISKRLCELMGGRIWVDSTPGRGSTFHFTLRAGRCEPHAEPCERDEDDRGLALEILVVDDDAASRRMAAAMVERCGHRARVAADGESAIRACAQHRFDAVLMDVEMAGLGGVEAARVLARAAGERPRIVALTGHAGPGVRERLLDAGFDAYLAKPLERRALMQAIVGGVPAAPLQAAAGDTAIDSGQIESLLELSPGGALLREVVDLFIGEAAPTLQALRADARRGDRRGVEQRSHRTRSTALACGAARVAGVCRELEESAAARALWRVPALVDRLQAEIERACAALAPLGRIA